MSREALFYPCRRHTPTARLFQFLAPAVARWRCHFRLTLAPGVLAKLQPLTRERVLLFPNHPTFDEPVALYGLSARWGPLFYYLTALEAMQGSLGPLLQRLGCYSVRRGAADRASVAQTLAVLRQPDAKLVVFAEGGCSFQNDTVMPLRAGGVQMAFQVLGHEQRQGHSHPCYVLPVSVKYFYPQDTTNTLERSLRVLEASLGLRHEGGVVDRLSILTREILERAEVSYGLQPAPGLTWDQRLRELKKHLLHSSEQVLGLASLPGEPDRDRAYRICNSLLEAPEGGDVFWTPAQIRRSMARVLNFDALYEGYVREKPTLERCLDTVARFERELLGVDRPPDKGLRQACLTVGEPLNLQEHLGAYQGDRPGTLIKLMDQIRTQIQTNLDTLEPWPRKS